MEIINNREKSPHKKIIFSSSQKNKMIKKNKYKKMIKLNKIHNLKLKKIYKNNNNNNNKKR